MRPRSFFSTNREGPMSVFVCVGLWQIIIHYSRFDPDSLDIRMHSEQKKIYQSMTPGQKLDVSMKLYLSAKALKTATIKEQHPDWNKEKIKKRVNDIFLYAGT